MKVMGIEYEQSSLSAAARQSRLFASHWRELAEAGRPDAQFEYYKWRNRAQLFDTLASGLKERKEKV